jgi:hypothetical protein
MHTSWQAIKDVLFPILATSFSASLAHSFLLPPWDAPEIAQFPRFQKYYRLFVYVVGYVAVNMRSTTFRSISIHNPDGLNANPPMDAPADKK